MGSHAILGAREGFLKCRACDLAALLAFGSLLANALVFCYNVLQLRSLFTRYESLFVSGSWEVAEADR
jgi:hypothetical protein